MGSPYCCDAKMIRLVSCVVLVSMLTLIQTTCNNEECCGKKEVGSDTYTLTVPPLGTKLPENCVGTCTYTKDNDPTSQLYCFAPGNETASCMGSSEHLTDDPNYVMGCGCHQPTPWCAGKCRKGICTPRICTKKPHDDLINTDHIPNSDNERSNPPHGDPGCPAVSTLPDMDADKKRFVCAAIYNKLGGKYGVTSCNGGSYYLHSGDRFDAGPGRLYPMGSILVKPGCTLYMFKGEYNGESVPQTTSVFYNRFGDHDGSGVYGPRSHICSCVQEPISCQPTDGWEAVVYCDNKNGVEPATCSYTVSVGTSYGETETNSRNIGAGVSASVTASLDGVFSGTVDAHYTTSFDWSKTKDITESKNSDINVMATVDAGNTLAISQAVGYCGNNRIKTNLFKFTQMVGGEETTTLKSM